MMLIQLVAAANQPLLALALRISEERDSRFTKSRTVVSLIPGQHGVVDFRLPG
ncbi:hypothetical protein [Rhizobium leguminosarum]|uniref:hypothetical protein n=1 Tax=Rhizobium leguminosarum TaxID=384 RepID=UPI00164A07CD|nr:hypothetical protein [Rhizobium leguminosarum]